ncbi:MFS transporter [Paraburkholderia sp. RL16-012-BIC-B]|jgi:MFS family permease|nr:MFS transporter [Paraburkholderia madseniana]
MSAPTDYVFKPHERPTLPGSPYNPEHARSRRMGYFAIGCLLGITQGLGNALVTVNLNFAQGTLGLFSNEANWLTAAYFMVYVSANLMLVKYRQQFGLQSFVRYTLVVHALINLLHLFVETFWMAVAVRAVSAIAAAGLTTLAINYLLQAMLPPKKLLGIMIGISIPQLAVPLARVLSPGLLDAGDWHMLYWFEFALALASLIAVMLLPLPPSDRSKVFEPLDFLTFGLLGPGLALLVAVVSEGRIEWWTERAWMGWSLAAGIALIAAGLLIEHRRASPLINTRWLSRREMVRVILVAAAIRILLSEQTFGSVGLLTIFGMLNDQMITLNLIILTASIAGIAVSVLTFKPDNPASAVRLATLLIAIGAFLDADATNLTRPANFYFTQALIGFASLLFLGRAMVIGMAQTLLAGGQNFVSFVVLFNISQSVGGQIGTAFLGTFQTFRERFHSNELVQTITMANPLVAARIHEDGAARFSQTVSREANILAYNDVFLLVGILAVLTLLWGFAIRWSMRRRQELSPIIVLQQKAMSAQAAQTGHEK